MKRHILTITFPILLLIGTGCGDTKNNQDKDNSSGKTEEIELQKEINSIDSVAIEIEKAKDEIQESSDKLDELLDNL